ncbi:heterochromatin protein 1-binding protein 3 [Camelus ferus]|nr:heterochromatin protein 1-binding protein 3 [Camelus ferus]
MATDTSQGELVHPKALPLIVGAQLIHADKLGEKVEDNTMPIRRAVNSTRETPPKSKVTEGEEEKPDVSSEESISTVEEQENETPPATSSETEQPKGEPESEEKEENKSSEETKKDVTNHDFRPLIPFAESNRSPDVYFHVINLACFQKSGASVVAIRKYIIHKYPSLELERRGYLLKQALKRELNRGVIKQNRSSAVDPEPQVKLEDILPLAFTRLCEPKEASYSLIRKYVSQYYPKLRVDIRPQLLKNALQRAVERGQLEQITGKGASGTFQLKKSGEKPLLGGSLMEYAILSAIAAMNEPKTCSTAALKKYVLENHPGTNSNYQRVLFPKKEPDDSKDEDEDEDESSEEDSEDEEPPPKRRLQKKTPAKLSGKAAPVKQRGSKPAPRVPAAQRGKARPLPKKAPPKAKTPAKKARPSPSVIKKPSGSSSKKPVASVRKEVKLPGKGKSTMKKSFKAKK